ncbi:MAG: hypothetical protein HY712_01630 [candidate division NC10 bacterium]|nr:hypothetical protein [candidate division NC10 bacterium]
MLVRNGLCYLTEHANDEAAGEYLTIYDVEHGVLTGRIRKTWPREGKLEIVGAALDGCRIGIVCRITPTNKGGGVRHYAANALKMIEESIRGRRKADGKVLVPIYSLWRSCAFMIRLGVPANHCPGPRLPRRTASGQYRWA